MKTLNSLLLLIAIVPTLAISFTGIATSIDRQSIALAQQTQASEVIDFGTRVVNARPTSLPLKFTVPAGQFLYKITPNNPTPFSLSDSGAYLGAGASRDITVQVKQGGGSVGVHTKTIEIRGNSQLIKQVVLKVKIVPVPPTNSVDGSNNQTQPNNGQNSSSDLPPTGGFGSPGGNRP